MGEEELMAGKTVKRRETPDPEAMVAALLTKLPRNLRGKFRRWLRQIILLYLRQYRVEIKQYVDRKIKALDRKYSRKLATLKREIREQNQRFDQEKGKLERLRRQVRRENEEFLDELYALFHQRRPHKESQVIKRAMRRERID